MMLSFADKGTVKVWHGERPGKLPNHIQEVGRRKLRMINSAIDLNDLRVPPANRSEKLSGDLSAFYSIRINGQWRVIFKWSAGNAAEVEIIDYH
jgi:proteic killer suppression protein